MQRFRHSISSNLVVLIAMYHGICESQPDSIGPWEYTISPSVFRKQIQYLSNEYEIVTLEDAVGRSNSDENLAVVTFDDGYRNNLTDALPVLEEYGVPATIYVSTSFVDGGVPYEYPLVRAISDRDLINVTLAEKSISYQLTSQSSRVEAFREIAGAVKDSPEARRELVEELSVEEVGVSMMDADEIREIDEHPLVTVGAHGHRHLPLASLSDSEIEREVETCTSELENILGHSVSHFSYPYGSNDARVRASVRNAGYDTGVTTTQSYIQRNEAAERPYQLPRFDASVAGVK